MFELHVLKSLASQMTQLAMHRMCVWPLVLRFPTLFYGYFFCVAPGHLGIKIREADYDREEENRWKEKEEENNYV